MLIDHHLTNSRRLLLGVGAVYLLAWFLPSVGYTVMGSTALLRGLDATREALLPIWPMEGLESSGHWWASTLSVVSALTNVAFVLAFGVAWRWASPTRHAARHERSRAASYWAAAVAASAAVNLWWLFGLGWGILREGYYLWVLSFIALAVVVMRLEQMGRRATAVRAAA